MTASESASEIQVRRQRLLARLATWCAILVLLIISFSAYLRDIRAGLGCTEWPQCYGRQLRQAQQHIAPADGDSPATKAVRMLHRVAAVTVLMLVSMMAVICFYGTPVLWREGTLALALLLLTLALAVLGRWSAAATMPIVTIGNLLGGITLLALCWRLRRRAAGQIGSHGIKARDSILRAFCIMLLAVQIALGGLVSAAYAGLSCTALPECGDLAWTSGSLEALNPWHEPVFANPNSSANPAGAMPHMAHRLGALVAFAALMLLGYRAWRGGHRRWAIMVMVLVTLEVGVGLLEVVLGLPLPVALAHNLIAALLLAIVVSG